MPGEGSIADLLTFAPFPGREWDSLLARYLVLMKPQPECVHPVCEVTCRKDFAPRQYSSHCRSRLQEAVAGRVLPPRVAALTASCRWKSPPSVRRAAQLEFAVVETCREEPRTTSQEFRKVEAFLWAFSWARKSDQVQPIFDRVRQPLLSSVALVSCAFLPVPTQ